MFRMEFRSLNAVEEDEDPARPYQNEVTRSATTVFEQYRQRSSDSPSKIYQGRLGKFGGQMQRVVSSNEAMHTVSHIPSVTVTRTRSLDSETPSCSLKSEASSRSLNSSTSIPKDWVEVDLIDFSDSPKPPQPQPQTTNPSTGEQEVVRELVKPFAESVNLTNNGGESPKHQPPVRDFLSNGVEESRDAVADAVSSSGDGNSSGSLRARTDSMPSTNSAHSFQSRSEGSDTESTTTTEEKGSPASNTLNKALNKFRHHKKSKPVVGESKSWDEPLLHVHEQVKMEKKAQNEAEVKAKRMAEAEKRQAAIQQRELLELANPVPESSLRHHGVRKGIHKLFHIHGGSHSSSPSPREGVHGDARGSKLVMPRAGRFEASPEFSPSPTDAALAQIRSGPRPVTKTDLKFETVESNQRDVQPWTMEEYMAKNARLEEWEERESDEEFGGIEGNNLLNQYFDNDAVLENFGDSDSD